jgi:hypothetical protein
MIFSKASTLCQRARSGSDRGPLRLVQTSRLLHGRPVVLGRRSAQASLFQIREIALCFDGCGATLTGCGNGLAIDRVGHVSSGKDSG